MLSKHALLFMCLQCKSFENTMGKREIAHNKQFLLFPECFDLLVLGTFCHFHQILNCRLLTVLVSKSLKFVIWERVKKLPSAKLSSKRNSITEQNVHVDGK